jgi:antitoxin component YwqK of YwqJK toxin-antitoxin module
MTYRSFHDNGQPALLFHTDSSGDLHGRYQMWFPNGQLHIERHYDHGRPDGLTTEWDATGKVVYQQRWFNRVPVN